MFHFLSILVTYLLVASTQGTRPSRNYCSFNRASLNVRFMQSNTTFTIRNTFAEVETKLWAMSQKFYRRRGSVANFFQYWLPNDALVSSVILTVSDYRYGTYESFAANISTNAEANAFYDAQNAKFRNKAQLVTRWTNEQFAKVVLKVSLLNRAIVSVTIGWQYAIELENNKFTLEFPVPVAAGSVFARTIIKGSIVEDVPINTLQLNSPSDLVVGGLTFASPVCEKLSNGTALPCSDPTNVNTVVISFDVEYWRYKRWLLQLQKARHLPWWYRYFKPAGCRRRRRERRRLGRRRRRHSDSRARYRIRAKNNLKKAVEGASLEKDLVFSVAYNHTLREGIPQTFPQFGQIPNYASPLPNSPAPFLWGNLNRTCWMLGITASQLIINTGAIAPDESLYPVVRRATFFMDDYTGVDSAYFTRIQGALERILTLGGTNRYQDYGAFVSTAFRFPNDTRAFNSFRIVVLAPDGTVRKFPTDGSYFTVATTDPSNTADLQNAINWVNALPQPDPCVQRPAFTFDTTVNEFVNTMTEYVDLAESLPNQDGQMEVSDIFYLSNAKPGIATGGNFLDTGRAQFANAVKTVQDRLRTFTGRTYGQPIHTFGFGPNSDFMLLRNLSSQNWGSTSMAFSDDSQDTVDVQIENFWGGIGRVIAGDVQINNFRTDFGDAFNNVFLERPTETSLSMAGYTIPVLRDLSYFNIFLTTPIFPIGTVGDRGAVATVEWTAQVFKWSFDFIPAGGKTRANVGLNNVTLASAFPFSGIDYQLAQDKLNLSRIWNERTDICRYGNVVKVLTYEKALRNPDATSLTETQLRDLVRQAGLEGGLQTSETSFVVADVASMKIDDQTNVGDTFISEPSTNGVRGRRLCNVFLMALVLVMSIVVMF